MALINPDCPDCGGTGHIYTALSARRCKTCLQRNLISSRLGFLNSARPIKSSPLAGKVKSNLFILASDDEANAHLKYTFSALGPDERWIYITDSDVLQAWFGKPNPAKAENLQDLVEYPFMVIRLGVLGYKNVSMPGVLHELLMLRVLSGAPTWLISHRELRADTCLEYSQELEILVSQSFKKVAMPRFRRVDTENAQRVAMGAGPARGRQEGETEVDFSADLNEGERAMRTYREETRPRQVAPDMVSSDEDTTVSSDDAPPMEEDEVETVAVSRQAEPVRPNDVLRRLKL